MYISYNAQRIITGISRTPFENLDDTTIKVPDGESASLELGKPYIAKSAADLLKVALICNWKDHCGISTYSEYLANALQQHGATLRVFSEKTCKAEGNVIPCWQRGKSMIDAMKQVQEWQPNYVILQHEFGIFPVASHFLKMIEMMSQFPYVVTLHSIYRHFDKTICTSAIRNVIVHTEQARQVLLDMGSDSNIKVIHHPCVKITPPPQRLWDIFHNQHTVIQFGFGFQYKGVDVAIDAVNILKQNPKYKDIFYCYLCSNSGHFDNVHKEYYSRLAAKVEKLKLHDNVVILTKFNTEATINNYLRVCRVAVFPYIVNPQHQVWGASGATRIAMTNRTPVVASDSSQFDDINGVVPRPKNGDAGALAKEIEKIFSDSKYRDEIVAKQDKYVNDHTWEAGAKEYLDFLKSLKV